MSYILSYLKREEPGLRYNQIKENQNLNSVKKTPYPQFGTHS